MSDSILPGTNHLLAALPPEVMARLLPHLEPATLPLGKALYESGDTMRHVYFPTDSIVSLLYVMENGASAEIAVVGNEGVVGVSLFMGGESTSSRAVVQSAGQALRLAGQRLKDEFNRHGDLQLLMLRYTQSLITQMAQTAVCNRHHSIDQQLCRWLLLSLDRLLDNRLVMTQELIANMLGVRREGVTEAAGKLQKRGVIEYNRGQITVIDRPQLEKLSCECYAVVKKESDRLLRKPPPEIELACAAEQRRRLARPRLRPGRSPGAGRARCGPLPFPESAVSVSAALATRNLFLRSLPVTERLRLVDHCEPVTLQPGELLSAPRLNQRHVHFPISGFVSVIVHLPGHPAMATGLVGVEGLVGGTLMLDASPAPIRALVLGAGEALRMTRAHFQAALCHCPQLLRRLNCHVQVLLPQLTRTALCTRLHSLEQRLVCWLLMTHDRGGNDRLNLTVELLAETLGASGNQVRRELAALDHRGLIRQARTAIRIVDRPSLESAACSCYEDILEGYVQSFGMTAIGIDGTVPEPVAAPAPVYVRQRTEVRHRRH